MMSQFYGVNLEHSLHCFCINVRGEKMKKIMTLLLIVLWTTFLLADWIALDDYNNQHKFQVTDENSQYLEVAFKLDGYESKIIQTERGTFTEISYPGSGEFLEVGKPDLPRFSKLISVPANGSVSIEILDTDYTTIENMKIYPQQQLQSEMKKEKFNFIIDEKYYNSSTVFPSDIVHISEPSIMRDLRVVTLTVNPFRYIPDHDQLEVIKTIKLRINYEDEPATNIKRSNRKSSKTFTSMYKSTVLNYDENQYRDDDFQKPAYLFIYPDDSVMPYLSELISWKERKGFQVYTANLVEAGSTLHNIKAYIQDAYDNWDNPPEFICIVGDAAGGYDIPTGHYSAGNYDGEGDHFYTLLEGNDYLSDIFIGRLSFNTLNELATIVSKILHYEKMPYMGDTDWFDSILLVGDPTDSGPSCVDTKLYVGQKMEQYNPGYDFTEVYLGNWTQNIASAINEGVSFFNYRGFANMSGWSTSHISALNNGFMLPVAVSITCVTGGFEGTQDCISERFLKAGTPSEPRGAIAAISTATGNTHTCFNNCMDAGIFEGIFVDHIFHMGGALNRGKLNLHLNYPQNPNNYVEKFSYWNNLMGDPGMDLWTTVPESLNVSYEDDVNIGTNYLDIFVSNSDGEPVAGAWVTARTENDEIFVSAYTDDYGLVRLDISSQYQGDVDLTVTKHDHIPHLGQFTMADSPMFLALDDYDMTEISGNFDNVINAGEQIGLDLILHNYGSQTTDNVTVSLSTISEGVSFDLSELTFNQITSDSDVTSNESAIINFSSFLQEGTEVVLDLLIQSGEEQWNDHLYLQVGGGFLQFESYLIIDGADNILDPGEEAELQLTLTNIGSNDLSDVSLTLSTSYYEISLENNVIQTSSIGAGETVTISQLASVSASFQIVPGMQIPINLSVTAGNGFEQDLMFLMNIGIVNVNHPLGPDNFGHYIYDDGDVSYINTQPYNWIEIDPDNGGPGVELDVGDVGNMGFNDHRESPFPITFYGITYDSLTICSNGWIAPGITKNQSFINWTIPGALGPSPMIAVFWDDLVMGEINGSGEYVSNGSSVCYYYDETNHYLVIQWSGLLNEYDLAEETFQCLIYDSAFYPTNTGDNMIKMQYQEVNNIDQGSYEGFYVSHGMFATVGIENYLSTDGIEYTYNNDYSLAARPLVNETALTISGAPINSEEAYLVVNNLNFIDEDGDDFLENGEAVDLYINLTNIGGTEAVGVVGTIISNSEYLNIITDEISYPNIESSSSGSNLQPFQIEIAQNCPDGEPAYFTFNISCDTGSWQLILHLDLSGPKIKVAEISIQDSNNHMLDPGETAELQMKVTNIGDSPAIGMYVQVESINDLVDMSTLAIPLIDLDPGESDYISIEIMAEETIEILDMYEIVYSVYNDQGYDFENSYELYITQYPLHFVEEFNESPPSGWVMDGNNWFINNSTNAGGHSPELLFWGQIQFAGTQRMITPPLNSLGSNKINVKFKHTLDGSPGEFSWGIQVSNDCENWNTVKEFEGSDQFYATENIEVQAPQIGADTLYVAVFITGNSQSVSFWCIDDFQVDYVPFDPPAFIIGHVTINNGDTNMDNVIIKAGEYETSPYENGDYLLNVQPGVYDVKAYKPGFIADIERDIIIEDVWSETSIDFMLYELDSSYSPENLVVEPNEYQAILNWDIPGFNGADTGRDVITMNKAEFTRERTLLHYEIYRDSELLTSLSDVAQSSYIDQPLDNGTYTYYIVAVYDDSVSAMSNVASVEITLAVPMNLVISTTPSGGNVIMNWQSPNDLVTSYRIYRDGVLLLDQSATYYIDIGMDPGPYIYGVSAVYHRVESLIVEQEIDVTSSDDLIPTKTVFNGNYPNPFNPSTTLSFELNQPANVELFIYNAKGRLVKTLLDSQLKPDSYFIEWNGKDNFNNSVGSGIYLCRMRINGKSFSTSKMILMK